VQHANIPRHHRLATLGPGWLVLSLCWCYVYATVLPFLLDVLTTTTRTDSPYCT